jgi:hypothetical protein
MSDTTRALETSVHILNSKQQWLIAEGEGGTWRSNVDEKFSFQCKRMDEMADILP